MSSAGIVVRLPRIRTPRRRTTDVELEEMGSRASTECRIDCCGPREEIQEWEVRGMMQAVRHGEHGSFRQGISVQSGRRPCV